MTKAGIRSAATELEGEPALDAVVVGPGRVQRLQPMQDALPA
jgi:hypothetical protein